MITNNLRHTTFYRCPRKISSLILLLRRPQQKPKVCQIKEQKSHFSDDLGLVRNNHALIESPYKLFISRRSIRENFYNYLIPSRNMASSSSSKSQNDDLDSTPKSNRRPKFSATKEDLKARLSPIQYQVTQLKATER